MSPQNSPLGKPPSNYNGVLFWKITEEPSRLAIMYILPILLAIVFGIGLFIFIYVFGGSPQFILSNQEIVIFIIGIPIILALHEFAHGIVMQSFGARPRYGFWKQGLMFYAKAPGYAFKRNQYALVVLAPLVSLSVLFCLGISLLASHSIIWVLALWTITNASAANVDVWITVLVLNHPKSAYVVDEPEGIRIFIPKTEAMAE